MSSFDRQDKGKSSKGKSVKSRTSITVSPNREFKSPNKTEDGLGRRKSMDLPAVEINPLDHIFNLFSTENEDWKAFFKGFLKKESALQFLLTAPTFRIIFSKSQGTSTCKGVIPFLKDQKFVILLGEFYCGSLMEKYRYLNNHLKKFDVQANELIKERITQIKSKMKKINRESGKSEINKEIFSSDSEEFSIESMSSKKRQMPKLDDDYISRPTRFRGSEVHKVTFTVHYSPSNNRRSERIARRTRTPYIKDRENRDSKEVSTSSKRKSLKQIERTIDFNLLSPRGRTSTTFSSFFWKLKFRKNKRKRNN